MSNDTKTWVYWGLGLLVACCLAVVLFTWQHFFAYSRFSTATGVIGDTIGGVTSPIIGIISSILLIVTLRKQNEANEKQSVKTDADIVFILFEQLEKDIESFVTKFSEPPKMVYGKFGVRETIPGKEHRYTGLEGMIDFAARFYVGNFPKNYNPTTFKHLAESSQILYILKSYNLVNSRVKYIQEAQLSSALLYKLDAIFQLKLYPPLKRIDSYLQENPMYKDTTSNTIFGLFEVIDQEIRSRDSTN